MIPLPANAPVFVGFPCKVERSATGLSPDDPLSVSPANAPSVMMAAVMPLSIAISGPPITFNLYFMLLLHCTCTSASREVPSAFPAFITP